MTTRERIERLLDQLSEDELAAEYQHLRQSIEGDRRPVGQAPGCVLHHMAEDEERACLSWEDFRP
jgi:hypothetical protein